MKSLAAFIMRGRVQAAMVASVLAALAVLITPLAIGSAAVIGLVTLRQGAREGILVMLMGSVALVALGYLLLGQPLVLAFSGALLWLPLFILGLIMRVTRSLVLGVELAVMGGALLVLLQYLLLDDVTGFWTGLLGEYMLQLVDPSVVTEADRQAMVDAMAPWMAGSLGAAWFLQLVLSLLLARSWQAALYNPGGFGRELFELRLRRWLLLVVPVILVVDMTSDTPGIMTQLLVVGMSAFFVQGVALVHGLVGSFKVNQAWLIGFYLLLVIAIPMSITAVAAAGYADGWLDIRARARARFNNDRNG